MRGFVLTAVCSMVLIGCGGQLDQTDRADEAKSQVKKLAAKDLNCASSKIRVRQITSKGVEIAGGFAEEFLATGCSKKQKYECTGSEGGQGLTFADPTATRCKILR